MWDYIPLLLVTLLFHAELCLAETSSVEYKDYDFPEADDLFSRRIFAPKARNYAQFAFAPAPVFSSHNNPKDAPALKETLAAPDSPIGYEVPCGVRRGVGREPGDKIVGGEAALPGEFPWIVSLQLLSGWIARHICGGAILSPYWIVTAGHCVADLKPRGILVVAGDHDLFDNEGSEQKVKVVRIVSAGFQSGNFTGDMALLQVNPPLKMDGKRVAPICLPNSLKAYTTGSATVAGWGKLSESGRLPHVLQHVSVPIMPKQHCQQLYDRAGYSKYMNKCQICGGYDQGGFDSCQGDSGGPLVCKHSDNRYYLCGVVSWGVGCARPMLPGVYTEVACYSDWIKTILYNVNDVVLNLPAYNHSL